MSYKDRTFDVWNTIDKTRFVVTDKYDADDEDRPNAVIFPVSELYDEATQAKRAQEYAKYLNKIEEAAKAAYEQIHLADILKR